MPSRAGRSLARALGIKLRDTDPWKDDVTLGDTVFSRADNSFLEEHPTVPAFFMGLRPSRQQASNYLLSLFPFLSWITKYNLKWFLGDLVAGKISCRITPKMATLLTLHTGVTVGALVVPQGMAYAKLANVDVQYGLYSSFMGCFIYFFFATSKDITIGVSHPFPAAMASAHQTISIACCRPIPSYRWCCFRYEDGPP
jgi:sodium-independent sulfate anion transporter 11